MAAKQCYQSKQLLYRSKWNSKNFLTIENGGSIGENTGQKRILNRWVWEHSHLKKNINRGMDKDVVHIYSGGEGNGNTLQYSCLENPADRGIWWAAVHGVTQSWTQLKQLSMHACMHWRRKWQPTPVFFPGESYGQRSLWATVYL